MKTATPQRTLWLAAGSLLAVVLALWAGFSLAGWTAGSVERSEHHVLRGDVKEVRVDGAFSELTLMPADGDQVVVDSRAKGSLWLPKIETRIDGNHVTVRGSCRIAVFDSCSARFVVRVPRGVAVKVDTRNGDVRASGLTGPVDLDVATGDIALAGLTGGTTAKVASGDIDAYRLGGRVRLGSISGDVTGTELESDVVDAHATSGDVFVDLAQAPRRVNAASTSGDVTILVPRGQGSYDTQVATSSGDAEPGVSSDPGADRSLSAVTTSGDVAIRYR